MQWLQQRSTTDASVAAQRDWQNQLKDALDRVPPLVFAAVVILTLIPLMVLVLALTGGDGTPPDGFGGVPDYPEATPTSAPPVTVTPTPACRPASEYLAIAERQRAHFEYAAAFETAKSALGLEDICGDERGQLVQLALLAGIDAIVYQTDVRADPLAQQRQVERYDDLRTLAEQEGLPLPTTTWELAGKAYANSSWLLAKRLFDEGFTEGSVAIDDARARQRYVSTLYNVGSIYVEEGTSRTIRSEGLRYLVASCRVDERYGVGDGAACGLLRHLLGDDNWPPAAATPLLPE